MNIRTWKRKALAILALAFLLGGTWLTNLIWFRPFNIDHFYSRFFFSMSFESPMMLTQMRMLPGWIDWYNDELDSFAPSRPMNEFRKLREALETLNDYDLDSLNPSQRLSADVMRWFLENGLRNEAFTYHDYPVNQMAGVQSALPTFMMDMHQVTDEGDARDFIARLLQFPRVFSEVREGLALRETRGVIPPRFVLDHVIAETRDFVSTTGADHPLYSTLAEKLEPLEIPAATRTELLQATANAIDRAVLPAYQALLTQLIELQPHATDEVGAWTLPNGAAYYRQMLRNHTTTDLDPQEIHAVGLREVERIQAEMDVLLRSQGHESGSVGQRMLKLSKQVQFLYPDTPAGREQVLADFEAILADVNTGLDRVFSKRPAAALEVKRLPELYEKTMPSAYYQPPARDGSRPGYFFVNLRSIEEIPKYGMRTLAFHEGMPGHHFQIALQGELEDLPEFRTMPMFTAYIEGWALYSEQVAAELGFQEDPYDRLGYLQAALFRAVRLVVDTGIHSQRWTREQAIEYMTANTGMPQSDVVAEIERYIVMPGQACAYMIGKLKILELRERAQQELGDRFNLVDFHRAVLENGAVPLSILEELIDEYIAEVKAAT